MPKGTLGIVFVLDCCESSVCVLGAGRARGARGLSSQLLRFFVFLASFLCSPFPSLKEGNRGRTPKRSEGGRREEGGSFLPPTFWASFLCPPPSSLFGASNLLAQGFEKNECGCAGAWVHNDIVAQCTPKPKTQIVYFGISMLGLEFAKFKTQHRNTKVTQIQFR